MILADLRDTAIILGNVLLALLKSLLRMDTTRELARFQAAEECWCQRHPAMPEDGCCGCGGDMADITITGPHPFHVGMVTEGYCWGCFDESPSLQGPHLQVAVFAGHERP